MFRKTIRKEPHHTAPDHRPMIPEFRKPGDVLDDAIRSARRRYDEVNPNQNQKWR